MSWFDSAVFASLAKSALNTAQKTIDRALDIQEEGSNVTVTQPKQNPEEGDEFFSSFGISGEASGSSKGSSNTGNVVKPPEKHVAIEQSPVKQTEKQTWGDWGSAYLPRLESNATENAVEISTASLHEEPPSSDINTPAMVFVQPIAEKLFPSSQKHISDTSKLEEAKCVPLREENQALKSDIAPNNSNPILNETSSSHSQSPLFIVASKTDSVSVEKSEPNSLLSIEINPHLSCNLEVMPKVEEATSRANEAAENLHDLSDEDDDDETEEELTVMERKPSRSLELQLAPCFSANDLSPTDYCFVDKMETSQSDSMEKQFSCSTSMEIINGNILFEEDEVKSLRSDCPEELKIEIPSHEVFSSPDSIVPIDDEPPNNLVSPHFPDIHVPTLNSPKNLPMDMCDSDVTLLSPSAGEEDSTDSEKESNLVEKIHYKEPQDVHEFETSSSASKTSNSSSSGSFVNCSLEDGDPCTREHSVSSTVASDQLKQETENSGHTSGDDVETTTSSDIEIISPSNGEGHPLSPLKHLWVPRRTKRSESPASDSSKEGMMPVVHEIEELMGVCSASFGMQSNDEALVKRLSFLQEVLEAREKRAIELSQENVELHESNSLLRSRIQRMEETHEKDSEGMSKMTSEFSQRLSQVESKLEETILERDSLNTQLTTLKIATTSKLSITEMELLIAQKDQQIAELMQEGEKLSKQQLSLSNIIKKLRTKEKETEATLKTQKEKLEEQSKEIERLRKSLGAKDEQEKKHIDAIRQLTTTITKQEEDLVTFANDLEDSNDKLKSMKTNLDAAYKEMTNAQKKLAEKESQIQEATVSAEIVAKESLRLQLEKAQEESAHERETLLNQVGQLQYTLNQAEQQANLREESLRTDIANLQKRLEEADFRNSELTQSVSSATRPLQRQLESLQTTYKNQTTSWDKMEESLKDTLVSTQKQLSDTKAQEQILREQMEQTIIKMSALETKNKNLNYEKIQLTSQLEVIKAKLSLSEESKHRDAKSVSSLKQKFAEEILQLKKEKEEALKQMEILKLEIDKKKEPIVEDVVDDLTDRASPPLSMTLSHHSSVSDSFRAWNQDAVSETGFEVRSSLPEHWWGGSASSMIEMLQSQVKLREGEIQQLQRDIIQLEEVRDSMVEELGLLARKTDELQIQLTEYQTLKDSFQDIQQKYNTLLQMYGEKVEEAEELKMDLSDVKTMYRTQIEELLKKS